MFQIQNCFDMQVRLYDVRQGRFSPDGKLTAHELCVCVLYLYENLYKHLILLLAKHMYTRLGIGIHTYIHITYTL